MKKIRNSLILASVIFIFAGGMFLTSCDKTELVDSNENGLENVEEGTVATIESYENLTVSNMPQLEVREGMLYFANSEQYFKTIAIVSKMSDEELDKWEQELGFVSLRTMQNKALDELESLEEEGIYSNVITKYSNYIKLKDNAIKRIVDDLIYSSIANQNGVYITGKVINKVIEEELISINIDGENILNNIDTKKTNGNVVSHTFIAENKSNYGTSKSSHYIRKKNRRNYRRVNINISIIWYGAQFNYITGDWQHTWKLRSHVNGEAWNRWNSSWKEYNTTLSFKYGKGQVYGPVALDPFHGGWLYGASLFSAWSKSSGREVKHLYEYKTINTTYSPYSSRPPSPYFKKVKIWGSSRGVGSEWAKINCGY